MSAEPAARDDGSILPLVLGFFLIAFLLTAGAVAAGDAYVDQRGLQHVCDAAAAAAASELDLDRSAAVAAGRYADFRTTPAISTAIAAYLSQDPGRAGVTTVVSRSGDGRLLSVRCAQRLPVTFGALFGQGSGVAHTVVSSCGLRSPTDRHRVHV